MTGRPDPVARRALHRVLPAARRRLAARRTGATGLHPRSTGRRRGETEGGVMSTQGRIQDLPQHTGYTVEWNPTDDVWLAASVLRADEGRLLIELHEQGQRFVVEERHTRRVDDLWQITIRVPMHLPVEQRHELFSAVAEAVHGWEPDDRDGWDADVYGRPAGER